MEKVGLNKLLSTMAMPVTRVQQAVVTMFAAHLLTDTHQTRLLQSKVLVHVQSNLLWAANLWEAT